METKKYKTKSKRFKIVANNSNFQNVKINKSLDSYNYCKQFYSSDLEIYESFFIVLLNRANNTIGYAKISQGGIIGTVVDTKIIAKYCVDSLASAVILCHNHPSGTALPSDSDIELTKKIKKALILLDVIVIDHIIITSDNYYSFADSSINF